MIDLRLLIPEDDCETVLLTYGASFVIVLLCVFIVNEKTVL